MYEYTFCGLIVVDPFRCSIDGQVTADNLNQARSLILAKFPDIRDLTLFKTFD